MFSRRPKETPGQEHNHQHSQSQSQSQSENQNDVAAGFLETDALPKKRGRKPGSTNAAGARQNESINKIRVTLQTIFGAASGMCLAAGGVIAKDGAVIQVGSPALIDAIIVLCQQDKEVRAFFLSLTTGSAYANVVIASLPIIIGILANHNLIPPIFGSPAAVAVEAPKNGLDN